MKTLDRMSFKSFHRMHHFKRRKITEKSWEFALWGHIWKQGYGYLGLLMCIYETLPKFVTYHRQKKKKTRWTSKNKQTKTLENAWLIILALPVYLSIQVIILFCKFSDSLFYDCLFVLFCVLFCFFFWLSIRGNGHFAHLLLRKTLDFMGIF